MSHIDRFLEKVQAESFWGCWEWTAARAGGRDSDYGAFWNGKKQDGAHRFAWEHMNGPIPEGMVVRHGCDRPRCVNPMHLSIGTIADNQNDMAVRGRSCKGDKNGSRTKRHRIARGSGHWKTKLSESTVSKIKADLLVESNQRNIARKYDLDYRTVWNIKHGRRWAHVRAGLEDDVNDGAFASSGFTKR